MEELHNMTQIKLRRDTSANFTSKNPVLGIGEPAYETDTKKLKIGDGTTAYNDLAYFAGGGGSTEFNVVQPLKLVDGTLTLQIDEQTIQVQDGKLVANLDELGNEVNTLAGDVAGVQADLANKQDKSTAVTIDTNQTISGQKEFNKAILFLSNNDLIRGQQSTAYRNGAGLSMGANSTSTDGGPFTPQWKIYNTTGGVDRTESIITTYNQSKLDNTNFNTASKLVRLDSDGKLPAIDGSNLTNLSSSSTPDNMVTTDTAQTITGIKTFPAYTKFDGPIKFTGTLSRIQNAYGNNLFLDDMGDNTIQLGEANRTTILSNTVKNRSGNKFLTSGDKETIMGYMMPDYSTRTEVPWNTDNTAPTDGYVEVFGEGDGNTSAYVLEYTLNGVKTAVSSCYATSSHTNFRLPVICPKGTVYSARGGANGHELHFISMKGAV